MQYIGTCQMFDDTSAAFVHALKTQCVTSATLCRVLFKCTSSPHGNDNNLATS